MITKCLQFSRYLHFTSSPFRSLIKGASPFFLMPYEWSSKTIQLLFYMLFQNIYEERVIAEKYKKKSESFSNSIFEPYRAPALFELETWDSKATIFSHFSIIRKNLKKISWVVTEKISEQKWHPENQKIVNISDRKWRHDLKSLFYSFQTNVHQPWKFHENPSRRFWEME